MNDHPLFDKGRHATHEMHENSKAAWRAHDKETRREAVLRVLNKHGPMTDRQICTALGSKDMNYARPAITHLRDEGVVYEMEYTKCPVTGRTVRIVGIVGVHVKGD